MTEVERLAGKAGRGPVAWRHGMLLWCSFDRSPAMLASAMEDLYRVPFERFARYCPTGPPDAVAAHARAYVDGGAANIDLAPVTALVENAIEGAAEVKRLLNG